MAEEAAQEEQTATPASESLLDGGDNAAAVQEQQTETGEEQAETPEWLQSKYITEGRSVEESITEQAKAYTELSGKFGAFTGAPEAYELNLSDEQKTMVMDDDPVIQGFQEIAKEAGINQEFHDKIVGWYLGQQQDEMKAIEEQRGQEMKALGDNAGKRIQAVNEWIGSNFEPHTVEAIRSMAVSSDAVAAIEQMIAKTRNAPQGGAKGSEPPAGITKDELNKMTFALDDFGNRRMSTDPEYRKRVDELWSKMYGNEPNIKTVG